MTNERELLLESLEEAGVDNWEGYSIAMDIFNKKLKEERIENDFQDLIEDLLIEVQIEKTEDPSCPNLYYDGDIIELYNKFKKVIETIEEK